MCRRPVLQHGGRAEFGPSPFWLGLLFAASGAGLLLGAVAGGRLADRIGRRPVLVGSLAAFGLASLLTTLAGNMQALCAMRFFPFGNRGNGKNTHRRASPCKRTELIRRGTRLRM